MSVVLFERVQQSQLGILISQLSKKVAKVEIYKKKNHIAKNQSRNQRFPAQTSRLL